MGGISDHRLPIASSRPWKGHWATDFRLLFVWRLEKAIRPQTSDSFFRAWKSNWGHRLPIVFFNLGKVQFGPQTSDCFFPVLEYTFVVGNFTRMAKGLHCGRERRRGKTPPLYLCLLEARKQLRPPASWDHHLCGSSSGKTRPPAADAICPQTSDCFFPPRAKARGKGARAQDLLLVGLIMVYPLDNSS